MFDAVIAKYGVRVPSWLSLNKTYQTKLARFFCRSPDDSESGLFTSSRFRAGAAFGCLMAGFLDSRFPLSLFPRHTVYVAGSTDTNPMDFKLHHHQSAREFAKRGGGK